MNCSECIHMKMCEWVKEEEGKGCHYGCKSETLVLDKIRTEIEQTVEHEVNEDKKWAIGLKYSLQIIDKYREERSE